MSTGIPIELIAVCVVVAILVITLIAGVWAIIKFMRDSNTNNALLREILEELRKHSPDRFPPHASQRPKGDEKNPYESP